MATERSVPSQAPLTSEVKKGDCTEPSQQDDFPRKILYSTKYRYDESLKAMVLVLRCAVQAAKEKSERKIPKHGDSVSGTCALCYPEGVAWKKVKETVIDFVAGPAHNTTKLFLWKDLGRGSSGRAFLAFSTSGRACVVKFFHYKRAELPDDSDAEVIEGLRQKSKCQANAERTIWHEVFPHYKDTVGVLSLNSTYGLIMPYFDPVQPSERLECLPKIRLLLLSFREKGYKYADGDIRWRHVGVRGSHISFIDLGSINKQDPISDAEIDEQMDLFRDRA
jgi:hypothetical protein